MTNFDTPAAITEKLVTQVKTLEPVTAIENEQGVYKILRDPATQQQIGSIKVFEGSAIIDRILQVHIAKPEMQLDAHMVAVLTQPDMLYPHLMFDCESLPEDSAFHIDLIHKQDISTRIDYIEAILEPLSPAFEAAESNPHFRFSEATRLMKAMLNPWMASYHCDHEHLVESNATIDAYVEYWLSLKDQQPGQIDLVATRNQTIADYDAAHRLAIYNPKVDILWDFIVNIIGLEDRDRILGMLQGK